MRMLFKSSSRARREASRRRAKWWDERARERENNNKIISKFFCCFSVKLHPTFCHRSQPSLPLFLSHPAMKWDYVEWNFRNFTYLRRRWWWQFCLFCSSFLERGGGGEVDKHNNKLNDNERCCRSLSNEINFIVSQWREEKFVRSFGVGEREIEKKKSKKELVNVRQFFFKLDRLKRFNYTSKAANV